MSGEIQRAVALAKLMVSAQDRVADLEEQLSVAKRDLARIETEDLPELMREIELTSFQLEDGSTVSVEEMVTCSITEARRAEAHAWLLEHGFGGLIKTEVSVAFGRGEHAAAEACAASIGGTLKEAVHPSTLKSFVKEQMTAGRPVPFDLFSVHPFNRAKLTRRK